MKYLLQAIILIIPAVALAMPWGAEDEEIVILKQIPLIIETQKGAEHGFTVEVADTLQTQMRGLMFRKTLADDAGMLFIYPNKRMVQMWMKNTVISLDILFIDSQGTILKVARDTVPHSLENIRTPEPVDVVLELRGGITEQLGIEAGDAVSFNLTGSDV